MLDARTITATLTLALLGTVGCSSGTPDANNPEGGTSTPAATSTAEAAPTAAPTADPSAAPSAAMSAAPAETAAAATTAAPTASPAAAMTLPAGRAKPMPPKSGKVVSGKASTRKGAEACCGEGTCGPC